MINNYLMCKRFVQNWALVLLGLCLALLLIEGGLRCGGIVYRRINAPHAVDADMKSHALRILCLGESTTAGQWPVYLQYALNDRYDDISCKVIDKGYPGTNTGYIASNVEKYLEDYDPDIVITMMGINDGFDTVLYGEEVSKKVRLFLQSFRVYKLLKIIYAHVEYKIQNHNNVYAYESESESLSGQEDIALQELREKYTVVKSTHSDLFEQNMATMKLLRKAIESGDATLVHDFVRGLRNEALDEESFLYNLGILCLENKWIEDAKSFFTRALDCSSNPVMGYVWLGKLYLAQGDREKADFFFDKAFNCTHQIASVYPVIADFYGRCGNLDRAEKMYRAAILCEPNNLDLYISFMALEYEHRRVDELKSVFNEAQKVFPDEQRVYVEFVKGLCVNELYDLAQETLHQAIDRFPRKKKYFGRILKKIKKYSQDSRKSDWDELSFFDSGEVFAVTQANYLRVKRIVLARDKKLVCMQYPLLDVELLKQTVEQGEDVYFVDNNETFRRMIRQSSYDAYFIDAFAGTFGHCTDKGNRLIAENVAEVIGPLLLSKKHVAGHKG